MSPGSIKCYNGAMALVNLMAKLSFTFDGIICIILEVIYQESENVLKHQGYQYDLKSSYLHTR